MIKRLLDNVGLNGVITDSFRDQISRIWLIVLGGLAISAVVLAFTFALGRLTDTPLQQLTREPQSVLHSSVYIGIQSNIGVLLFGAAAAVCFFAARWLFLEKRDRQTAIPVGLVAG